MSLTLTLRFGPNIAEDQKEVFERAGARWSEIITADLPTVVLEGAPVQGVVIDADVMPIDEAGGTLGRAGPTILRGDTRLPVRGIMEFDGADIASLEAAGTLDDVIIHEMGHVLGFGTLWSELELIDRSVPMDPKFVGPQAMAAFGALRGAEQSLPVPLANTGGPGTFAAHWREGLFTNELMTGFINAPPNPLSRLSIASMADLGYEVDIDRADDYQIANMLGRFIAGFRSGLQTCTQNPPDYEIMPCD